MRGCFALGEWPSSRLPQESQAGPPHCLPLPPAIHEPASCRRAGHHVPPLPATSSYQPCGNHSIARRPIFLLISLAQLALTKTGRGVRCDLATPPATQHPSVERGLSPGQSSLALTGSFPKEPRQAQLPQSPSSSSSPAAAPLPCCGPAAGERADGGRFWLWHVSQA